MSRLADYRTKTQIILDEVRARIVSGVLKPGERLIIRAVADDFACSDIPVREALRTLESEGLVNIVPHGGARVTELNGEELLELTEARALLEPEATVLAAKGLQASDIEALRRLAARMQSPEVSGPDYGRLNREFHRAILIRCPNKTIVALIEDLWGRAERGRAVHRLFEGHRGTSIEHHDRILQVITRQDFKALRAVCVAHAEHGIAAIRRLVEEDRADKKHVAPTSV